MLFLAAIPVAIAQATPKKPAPAQQKPMEESVYSQPWEQGEVKMCLTYSTHPFILICDEDSLTKAIANHVVTDGMSKDDATNLAVEEARLQTKDFVVQFIGKYPWVISKKPIPPGTPNIMVVWPRCSKDKIIVCKP
jgi:hypothetical protein